MDSRRVQAGVLACKLQACLPLTNDGLHRRQRKSGVAQPARLPALEQRLQQAVLISGCSVADVHHIGADGDGVAPACGKRTPRNNGVA